MRRRGTHRDPPPECHGRVLACATQFVVQTEEVRVTRRLESVGDRQRRPRDNRTRPRRSPRAGCRCAARRARRRVLVGGEGRQVRRACDDARESSSWRAASAAASSIEPAAHEHGELRRAHAVAHGRLEQDPEFGDDGLRVARAVDLRGGERPVTASTRCVVRVTRHEVRGAARFTARKVVVDGSSLNPSATKSRRDPSSSSREAPVSSRVARVLDAKPLRVLIIEEHAHAERIADERRGARLPVVKDDAEVAEQSRGGVVVPAAMPARKAGCRDRRSAFDPAQRSSSTRVSRASSRT